MTEEERVAAVLHAHGFRRERDGWCWADPEVRAAEDRKAAQERGMRRQLTPAARAILETVSADPRQCQLIRPWNVQDPEVRRRLMAKYHPGE